MCGTGSSTYIVVDPAGAAVGSVTVGTVTRRDGSGISSPRSMIASKAPSQSVAEVDVVVAQVRRRGHPRRPTCHTTAEGEKSPVRTARGAATPGSSRS